jgi:cell division protein FtsB
MNFSKILSSKIALVLAICLVGYLSFSLSDKIAQKKESGARVAGIKMEIEELTQKEVELLKLQSYYNSEDFLHKEARRILGYQKPGEEVYVLIPQKGKIEQVEEKEEFKLIEKQEKINLSAASNPVKWWHFFFE